MLVQVPSFRAGEAQSSTAAPARPELFNIALHEDDKVFKYGDHKGRSYAQVMTDHPEYLVDVKKMTTRKGCPKYITEFIEWTEKMKITKPVPARTRKGAPEKKEHPCAEGCKMFSRAGTNAYVSVVTCLECGHGT